MQTVGQQMSQLKTVVPRIGLFNSFNMYCLCTELISSHIEVKRLSVENEHQYS